MLPTTLRDSEDFLMLLGAVLVSYLTIHAIFWIIHIPLFYLSRTYRRDHLRTKLYDDMSAWVTENSYNRITDQVDAHEEEFLRTWRMPFSIQCAERLPETRAAIVEELRAALAQRGRVT
jgi:hypothetical protein